MEILHKGKPTLSVTLPARCSATKLSTSREVTQLGSRARALPGQPVPLLSVRGRAVIQARSETHIDSSEGPALGEDLMAHFQRHAEVVSTEAQGQLGHRLPPGPISCRGTLIPGPSQESSVSCLFQPLAESPPLNYLLPGSGSTSSALNVEGQLRATSFPHVTSFWLPSPECLGEEEENQDCHD